MSSGATDRIQIGASKLEQTYWLDRDGYVYQRRPDGEWNGWLCHSSRWEQFRPQMIQSRPAEWEWDAIEGYRHTAPEPIGFGDETVYWRPHFKDAPTPDVLRVAWQTVNECVYITELKLAVEKLVKASPDDPKLAECRAVLTLMAGSANPTPAWIEKLT